ncbi:MAG: isochorismate synthase [Chitinophagaceae bacterium]|nr:isochorismate synthase [Chitinophagaceae bacterium]MCW5905177.1 isochorismate synthase [Chitinophagaceae bacterium]
MAKHIPFCLYHYPKSHQVGLAVQENYLPHNKSLSFLIVPFHHSSTTNTQKLFVVNNEALNNHYLQFIESCTPLSYNETAYLPQETTKEQYVQSFQTYTELMHSGKINKAILSRVIHKKIPENFDIITYYQTLKNAYPNAFVYLSAHPQYGIWMGASPELLLKKNNQQISIVALAGTQKLHDAEKYTWRTKEQEEHRMVVNYIEDVFKKNHIELIEKGAMKTVIAGQVAHLKTEFIFKDNPTVSIEKLLHNLHPTPAVGGLPKKESIDCIQQFEGYDRAYYTGYIGMTDFDKQADFYVNLRCMQITKNTIAIYVGGGITASSNAEEEWTETTLKSNTLLKYFYSKKIND